VLDEAHAGILLRQRTHHGGSIVAAPVIDNDDLEVIDQGAHSLPDHLDHGTNVRGFIVGGQPD